MAPKSGGILIFRDNRGLNVRRRVKGEKDNETKSTAIFEQRAVMAEI